MERETQKLIDLKEGETEALLNQPVDEIPYIPVTILPSGFKGYPEGTKISYRPITLGELEALNTGDMDATRAVAMLLNAISCNTLPSEDLYYCDVMFIGIQRKLQAMGDVPGTAYGVCPHCKNFVEKKFNFTELEFKELQVPALPMKMTINNKPVEFGLVTMKEFLQINVEDGELGVYARMIKNMEYEEASNLVKNCYGLDIKKLRFMDKQLDYGIKPFHVKCLNQLKDPKTGKVTICNHDCIVEVKSPFEVVFPEDELGDDNEFEVQYG